MTEAMWIELIRVLPTFMWLGFAVTALVVARRLLTREAHRMTRVETPFVSVELAREVIEQAGHRREEHADAPAGTLLPYPLPSQAGGRPPASGGHAAEGADEGRSGDAHSDGDRSGEDLDEPEASGAEAAGETPPQPAYPRIPPQRGFPPNELYPSATEHPTEPPRAMPPGPPYRPLPAMQGFTHDSQRGLRAATRLSLSTDLLLGGSILWVDDHHEWNEPLVRLFRTAGIKVDTVDSTDEAMRAMSIAPYDLVISDMRREHDPAGESAGMALLDRMVGAGIPTPAIFFSGSAKAFAAVHPRAATATSSPEELVNHVIDIVGRRRQYGEGKSLRLPWGQR